MTNYELFDFFSAFIFTVLLWPLFLYGISKSVNWADRRDPDGGSYVWVIIGYVVVFTLFGLLVRELIFILLEQCFGLQKPPLTKRAVGRFKHVSRANMTGVICGVGLFYIIAKLTRRK